MSGTPAPLAAMDVLVVEDQYYVAMEMKRLVGQLGGRVLGPARDVASALALLEGAARPDFAVLDVNLDGGRVYALAEVLRARGVPFVFATGYEGWAIDPGFAQTPIVSKPVTAGALAAVVGQRLQPAASGESDA